MLQEGILSKASPTLQKPMQSESGVNSGSGIFSDYLGLSGSILCLIHCLAPQLLVMGSLGLGMASFFSSGWWHLVFWATCLIAVWQSSKISPVFGFQLMLWLAFGLFTIGTALDFLMGIENMIAYVGSAFLVAGHGWNLWRLTRKSAVKVCTN